VKTKPINKPIKVFINEPQIAGPKLPDLDLSLPEPSIEIGLLNSERTSPPTQQGGGGLLNATPTVQVVPPVQAVRQWNVHWGNVAQATHSKSFELFALAQLIRGAGNADALPVDQLELAKAYELVF
jgi:hypothetical protein